MGELLDASFSFPAVIFSVLMVLVIVYWLIVLIGALDIDLLDADADVDAGGGLAGLLSGIGLGGVPVMVALSLLIAFAWFTSLVGTVLVSGLLRVAVIIAALVVGWIAARVLVSPLRRLFPDDKAPSRHDFVGKLCLIKTSRVDTEFGQAEVTAADGSTAIIQVRRHDADAPTEPLSAGNAALIFEYDIDGEFFWVTPYDSSLDPDRSAN